MIELYYWPTPNGLIWHEIVNDNRSRRTSGGHLLPALQCRPDFSADAQWTGARFQHHGQGSSFRSHHVRPANRKLVAAFAPNGESDRKSTRLNSSHLVISYAVFCLKKKKRTFN